MPTNYAIRCIAAHDGEETEKPYSDWIVVEAPGDAAIGGLIDLANKTWGSAPQEGEKYQIAVVSAAVLTYRVLSSGTRAEVVK